MVQWCLSSSNYKILKDIFNYRELSLSQIRPLFDELKSQLPGTKSIPKSITSDVPIYINLDHLNAGKIYDPENNVVGIVRSLLIEAEVEPKPLRKWQKKGFWSPKMICLS